MWVYCKEAGKYFNLTHVAHVEILIAGVIALHFARSEAPPVQLGGEDANAILYRLDTLSVK